MKHRYGDVIKVLANTEISRGDTLTNGRNYDIRRATEYGVYIVDDRGESFFVPKSQLHYTELLEEENGMKWKIGDGLRVANNTEIQYGEDLTNGMLYAVVAIDKQGLPQVVTDDWHRFEFVPSEMKHVERIPSAFDDEDTERNAELGEPSADCNCVTLTEIYDEICDMKAMIGRLIRNGGDAE